MRYGLKIQKLELSAMLMILVAILGDPCKKRLNMVRSLDAKFFPSLIIIREGRGDEKK